MQYVTFNMHNWYSCYESLASCCCFAWSWDYTLLLSNTVILQSVFINDKLLDSLFIQAVAASEDVCFFERYRSYCIIHPAGLKAGSGGPFWGRCRAVGGKCRSLTPCHHYSWNSIRQGFYSVNLLKHKTCLRSVLSHWWKFFYSEIEAFPILAKTKICICGLTDTVTYHFSSNISELQCVHSFHVVVQCRDLRQTWRTPLYCFCDYLYGHVFVSWYIKFSGTNSVLAYRWPKHHA